jgi:hypothetical protein
MRVSCYVQKFTYRIPHPRILDAPRNTHHTPRHAFFPKSFSTGINFTTRNPGMVASSTQMKKFW